MTTTAIVMMVISMLILWGGLVAATLNLFLRGSKVPTDRPDL